jgi:hypothetical protein
LLLAFSLVLASAGATAGGCGGSGGSTGTTSTTSTGTGSTGMTTGTGGSGGSGGQSGSGGQGGGEFKGTCDQCLASRCADEIAACDGDCVGIQACLDAVCVNLSQTQSPDEGTCQVHCQSLHSASKAKHLAVVNCVIGSGCQPPCAGYSYDWDQCVAAQSKGACKSALDACNANSDCTAYQACAATCTTYKDCLACSTATSGATMGEQLYEAYWQCVETTCLPDGWLQSF